MRNHHPAQLQALSMRPRGTTAVAPGDVAVRWDNGYTSLFLGGTNGVDRIELDGESWVSSLALRTGVLDGVDFEVELPFVYYSGGFLDRFVVNFHRAFGLPQYGRDTAPRNQFDINAQRGGQDVLRVQDDEPGIMDLPLHLHWALLEPGPDQPLGFALRGSVELPTGSESRGFGNGKVDWGVGMVGEWRQGPLAFTAQAQHSFVGNPDAARRVDLEYEDVTAVGGGVEWALERGYALLAQVQWENSVLGEFGTTRASRDQTLLWGGVRKTWDNGLSLDLGLGEDLSEFVAPDFTAWIALRWQ